MRKYLIILSLVFNSQTALSVDVKEDVRKPQTVKDEDKKKDENYEDKEATEKYKAEKEKKYNQRMHHWMDKELSK